MAKRFTDTEKYKKAFIRSLPGPYKLFWDYLYHDCNYAGIWQVDFEVARIYLGPDMKIDPETALRLFNATETRVAVLGSGEKWFIKPFIAFQYKVPAVESLNRSNKVHATVLDTLIKEGAYAAPSPAPVSAPVITPAPAPAVAPTLGAKEKDKDKEKDKEKDVRGSGGFGFDAVWSRYPRKLGRKDAERFFKASVKTPQDYLDLQNALDCFIREIRKESRPDDKIPYGSTWFNGWRDWVNYGGVQMPKPPAPKPRLPDPVPEENTHDDILEMHRQTIAVLKKCPAGTGCTLCIEMSATETVKEDPSVNAAATK